ncbi:MAG: hypothetical protein U0169_00685 [Polyangiaceae bacterium]
MPDFRSFLPRGRRWLSPVVGLSGVALALGCASDPASPWTDTPRAVPDGATPTAVRADLRSIREAAGAYDDVPRGEDDRTRRYFENAARLVERQEELAIARAVEADLEAVGSDRAVLGHMEVDARAVAAELAHAKAERIAKERAVEDVLDRATADGLPLREASGRPVDAARVLRARFWRDVSARAEGLLATDTDESVPPGAEMTKFVDDVRATETFDTHEVVEAAQIKAILANAGRGDR